MGEGHGPEEWGLGVSEGSGLEGEVWGGLGGRKGRAGCGGLGRACRWGRGVCVVS